MVVNSSSPDGQIFTPDVSQRLEFVTLCGSGGLSRSWGTSGFPVRAEGHCETVTGGKSSVFHPSQEAENPSKCTSHLRTPFLRAPGGQVCL